MTSSGERYDKLCDIFAEARKLPEGDARTAYLDTACGNDAALRRDVVDMLAASRDGDTIDLFNDTSIENRRRAAEAQILSPSVTASLPESIGRYRIVRRIASGGMGTVFEAEQDSPKRRVALKMVHAQRSTPALVERLQREGEILGRLQHPGIAQVYDASMVDLGDGAQPYFAMEFVDGVSLTKYADTNDLDDRQRLELLAKVCEAAQYAHSKGVVHRDLKPDNILVTAAGAPKILDFGVARTTGESTYDMATMTREGQIIGTLSYMAPEQMDGEATVTHAADVYALGVIAFELLAGRLPHDITSMSIASSLKWFSEHDAPQLSTIDARYRGDVATIVAKALERDPQRRYDSASALAADIRRYLTDQPIAARPPSAIYRATKFARRNSSLVGGAAATMLALLIGLGGTIRYAMLEADQRELAETNEKNAKENLVLANKAKEKTTKTVQQLQQVVEFQDAQFSAFEPRQIGRDIHAAILNLAEKKRRELSTDDETVERYVQSLDATLRELGMTSVAATMLRETFFNKARAAIRSQFADQPLVRARLLSTMGAAMYRAALYADAREDLQEAYEIQHENLGEQDPYTLKTLSVLSGTQRQLGLREQRVESLRALCTGYAEIYGATSDVTLSARTGLTAALEDAGKTEEARDVLQDTLESLQRAYGVDTPETLTVLGMITMFDWRLGRRAQAVETLRRTIELQRKAYGESDHRLLSSRGNLAIYLTRMGHYEEGIALLEDNLAIQRRVDSRDLKGTLNSLAAVLEELGRHGEAEPYRREFVSIEEVNKGRSHIDTQYGLEDVALNLRSQGRIEEAIRLFGELLQNSIEARGEAHQTTHSYRVNLASALVQTAQFAEAEPLAIESERLYRDLGVAHDRYVEAIDLLVSLYSKWHEAEPDAGYDKKAAEWDVISTNPLRP